VFTGLLSGTENEGVIFGQRKRIGGELVQRRIAELKRRLHLAALLLLRQDIGDIVGAESTGRVSFGDRRRDSFRTIFADQSE
jgi:hypothetical protein